MTKRSDGLLQEIEAGALDSRAPISDLLRKVIALGGRTDSTELRDWAAKELRGYEAADELPSYRRISAPLAMDATTMHGIIRGQQLSSFELPDFARDTITNDLEMRQGIGEIEQLSLGQGKGETVKLAPAGSPDLVAYINAEGQSNGRIERIYWAVSPVTMASIVDQVRTALTVLVSEINANMPAGSVTPPSDVATRAINFAVNGKRNTVKFVAAQGEDASVIETVAPEETQRNWLRIAGGVLIGLITIVGVIIALMQAQGWRLG